MRPSLVVREKRARLLVAEGPRPEHRHAVCGSLPPFAARGAGVTDGAFAAKDYTGPALVSSGRGVRGRGGEVLGQTGEGLWAVSGLFGPGGAGCPGRGPGGSVADRGLSVGRVRDRGGVSGAGVGRFWGGPGRICGAGPGVSGAGAGCPRRGQGGSGADRGGSVGCARDGGGVSGAGRGGSGAGQGEDEAGLGAGRDRTEDVKGVTVGGRPPVPQPGQGMIEHLDPPPRASSGRYLKLYHGCTRGSRDDIVT